MPCTAITLSPRSSSAASRAEAPDHGEGERGRTRPVDDPVVERDRDVAHLPYDDLAVAHDRSWPDSMHSEDRDLGMIDERRDDQAAELAGARHREGRSAQLVRFQRPCTGAL